MKSSRNQRCWDLHLRHNSSWIHTVMLLGSSTKLIIITITVEICMNIRTNIFVILYANCCTNCYYNFNYLYRKLWYLILTDLFWALKDPVRCTRTFLRSLREILDSWKSFKILQDPENLIWVILYLFCWLFSLVIWSRPSHSWSSERNWKAETCLSQI